MNGQIQKQTAHEIWIGARKEMKVMGIQEVIRFDETCVVLLSNCGEVSVEGSDLRVGALDTERGVVTVSGRIDSLYYSDDHPEEKRGFFGKLFR